MAQREGAKGAGSVLRAIQYNESQQVGARIADEGDSQKNRIRRTNII